MKKAMLYVLALCICLTMAGCRREVLPAGEVDESQAGTEANAPIDCSDAPLDSTEMESSAEPDDGEDPVSSDASGEVSVVAPPVVSDVATETEPPSSLPAASADPGESAEESAGESAAPPVISTVSLPASYFTPPNYSKLHEHRERTLERLIAWINSEEALTEEDGVYKEAVEYYRERGYLFYAAILEENTELNGVTLLSNAQLLVSYKNAGGFWITPLQTTEAEAAAGGIAAYLESKGHEMNVPTVFHKVDRIQGHGWGEVEVTATYTPCQVTMATATQNAVLYVEDYDETAIGYYKFFKELHWLEGGFHIWHSSGTADPDLAYTPNQELMAKVQMINVPLNDSVS